ncbi:MAG: prepilin-type N-terminal cleavage/methylation domain-containing protein [Thiothrix sp.]|nr:prepilin-type N-terminal cleavage/methylation domain-containing protein [Thiothrix sp.]
MADVTAARRVQSGFTILEMMVALVLMALLFLALFSGFNTIGRSWDATEARINRTEDMRLVGEFLRSQLSQAMVVRIPGDKGPVYAFEGTRQSVRYAAPLQPLQHNGGIYLIELAIASGKQGEKLEMRYAPYRPDMGWDDAFEAVDPVLVYDGLGAISFEYYASESMDEDPYWQDNWEEKTVYPLLLRIRIEDRERRPWPELVIDLPQVDEYVASG